MTNPNSHTCHKADNDTTRGNHINIVENINKITNDSNGILSEIILGIDRIVISFRINKDGFSRIKQDLNSSTKYIRTSRISNKSFIYQFEYNKSKILLKKNTYHPNECNKYYYGWHSITITDADADTQLLIKNILTKATSSPITGGIKPKLSLGQVEFSSDLYPSDPSYTKPLTMLLQRYAVLRYTGRNNRSFQRYYGTTYQGKDHNLRKGSKGIRTYRKDENGREFTRLELQVNKGFLKNHDIRVASLPISPYDLSSIDFIDIRKGLDTDSLRKICTAFSKKQYKRTRGVPNLEELTQVKFYHIFMQLFKLSVHTRSYSLESCPVADQIHYFTKFKKMSQATHQFQQFFPKMSWPEFFQLVHNEANTIPEWKKLLITNSTSTNHSTYIDPEPDFLSVIYDDDEDIDDYEDIPDEDDDNEAHIHDFDDSIGYSEQLPLDCNVSKVT